MSSSITSYVLYKYGRLFVPTFRSNVLPSIFRLTVMIQLCAEVMGLKNKLSVVEEVLREGRMGYWIRPQPMRFKNSESCSCVLVSDTWGSGNRIAECRNMVPSGNKHVLMVNVHLLMLTWEGLMLLGQTVHSLVNCPRVASQTDFSSRTLGRNLGYNHELIKYSIF
jgi:hypothetical protein